jgi:hypothetical protein
MNHAPSFSLARNERAPEKLRDDMDHAKWVMGPIAKQWSLGEPRIVSCRASGTGNWLPGQLPMSPCVEV